MASPPVVEDPSPRPRDRETASIHMPERLGIANRANSQAVAYGPDLRRIPSLPPLHMTVVAEEVQVVEEQRLHTFIGEQRPTPLYQPGVFILMHDLVSLHVEAPVARARVEGQVREVGISALPPRCVPCRVDDFYASIVERRDQVPSAVVPVGCGDHHDELIHHREDRLERLPQGIPERDGIADEGEAGDAH